MDLRIRGIYKLFNYSKLDMNQLGTKVATIIDPRK